MPGVRFRNTLLNSFDEDTIQRLKLRRVLFEVGHEIEFPGNPIDHLYFIEEGMACMTTTFRNGTQVEVCMYGYKSIIGVSALMGAQRSLNRVYTQIAGNGYSCRAEDARIEFARGGRFQALALRYVQAQLVQAMQSAGCNAKHEIEQRLASWLLFCADRVHTPEFKMRHELLADMLGTTRSSVSVAAAKLKERGIIEYIRADIRILDPQALEKHACECYPTIRDYLNSYTEFDTTPIA